MQITRFLSLALVATGLVHAAPVSKVSFKGHVDWYFGSNLESSLSPSLSLSLIVWCSWCWRSDQAAPWFERKWLSFRLQRQRCRFYGEFVVHGVTHYCSRSLRSFPKSKSWPCDSLGPWKKEPSF